jgi:hypothetical protein
MLSPKFGSLVSGVKAASVGKGMIRAGILNGSRLTSLLSMTVRSSALRAPAEHGKSGMESSEEAA